VDEVAKAQVQAPTLLIVGSVVRLHDKLAWFSPETRSDHEAAIHEPGRGENHGL